MVFSKLAIMRISHLTCSFYSVTLRDEVHVPSLWIRMGLGLWWKWCYMTSQTRSRWYSIFLVLLGCSLLEPSYPCLREPKQPMERPTWKGTWPPTHRPGWTPSQQIAMRWIHLGSGFSSPPNWSQVTPANATWSWDEPCPVSPPQIADLWAS